MRTLIFSDLHGNLIALEKLKQLYPDCINWISLGDNVNYGPWSNECVMFLEEEMKCKCIKGNHEEYFINGSYPGKNVIANAFFNFCYKFFNKKEIIINYLDSFNIGSYTFTHTIDGKYIFDDTEIDLERNYVIGHSHKQYHRTINGFSLINPGSLGQDRQYINRSNYCIYDHDKNVFSFHTFIHDINKLISEMKSLNYPEICIEYYKNKEQLR